MNFGYLPKTDIETGNLRSESQLIDAIKSLQVRPICHAIFGDTLLIFPFDREQTIGNIPATGVIDEQTKRLMTRPRCGLPDSEFAREFYADNQYGRTRRRQKRFVVLGRKWEKTDLTWRYVHISFLSPTPPPPPSTLNMNHSANSPSPPYVWGRPLFSTLSVCWCKKNSVSVLLVPIICCTVLIA